MRTEVLVVGAGATGAGTARDLAMRGRSVLLIDRGDFCSLTSGGNLSLESGTNILAARGNLLLNCGGDFTLTNSGVAYF
ncbi:MAG: FAD-dependent oxidoreductase, partial [Methanomassiliicoccales archaeon]